MLGEKAGCPLVSVIIPTYNREQVLKEAINSVADQTHNNIELIVVDDASSVPAENVLQEFSEEPLSSIECIRHKENRGANAARNSGIKAATGSFIAFLDDDDWWEPDKLEKQIEGFKSSNPDTGVVYVGRRIHMPNDNKIIRTPNAEGDLTKPLLLGNPVGSFSTVMVRKEAINECGLPDEELPNAQDREWYIRLSHKWKFVSIQDALANIREDGEKSNQLSHDLNKRKDVSYPKIIEKHRSLAREYGILFERKMIAQLSFQIGYRAFWSRQLKIARYQMLKAIAYYPLDWRYYVGFVGALFGGPLLKLNNMADDSWKTRLKEFYFAYFH